MSALRLRSHSRGLNLSPRRRNAAAGAVPSYAATPVNFDGLTRLTRGGALSGVSDSKVWSGSIWLRLGAVAGLKRAFNSSSDRFSLLYFGGAPADYVLFGFDAGAQEILRLLVNGIDDTNWHHLLWSFDLANASNRHFFLDDVASGTWATYTDGAIDFTVADLGVGSDPGGNDNYAGDMADVWLRFGGAVIDFGMEANRRQFITAEGKPADPAAWPAGGQVQLHGPVDEWQLNKGSGGGFTEIGALEPGFSPVQLGHPTVADAEAIIEASAPRAWWKFDDGSGQQLTDHSGNDNHATLGTTSGVNPRDPTWQASPAALSFDGGDQAITASIVGPTAFEVAMLVYGDSTSQNFGMIFVPHASSNYDSNATTQIFKNGANATLTYRVKGNTPGENGSVAVFDDAWHILQAWCTGTHIAAAVDGAADVALKALAVPLTASTDIVGIGARANPGGPALGMKGKLAYLVYYPRVLSDAERAQNYGALLTVASARGITLP